LPLIISFVVNKNHTAVVIFSTDKTKYVTCHLLDGMPPSIILAGKKTQINIRKIYTC